MAAQLITYLANETETLEIPEVFPNPVNDFIHPLAQQASQNLQISLKNYAEQDGVMFGVIVVLDHNGRVGYFSGFSGRSESVERINSFVPLLKYCRGHDQYFLENSAGNEKPILSFFNEPNSMSNIGDCVTIKLLQYAIHQKLRPLATAEFWWGKPPVGRIRHHGYYYPACRGKCAPILPFLLEGLTVQPIEKLGLYKDDKNIPKILFEDDELMVVDKPAGLLSVPGKLVRDSVITRLQAKYPQLTNLILLHRLDLATSGLLLVAKTVKANRILQKQFMNRTIEKCYVAVLSRDIKIKSDKDLTLTGTIDLPLRVDIEDRPRQMVCYSHGKPATTRWKFQRVDQGCSGSTTRVYFYPVTGRTHQLRVHASHKDGLNAPIVGDPLYGKKSHRLMLHAESIRFYHPKTGVRIEIKSPAPF